MDSRISKLQQCQELKAFLAPEGFEPQTGMALTNIVTKIKRLLNTRLNFFGEAITPEELLEVPLDLVVFLETFLPLFFAAIFIPL